MKTRRTLDINYVPIDILPDGQVNNVNVTDRSEWHLIKVEQDVSMPLCINELADPVSLEVSSVLYNVSNIGPSEQPSASVFIIY